MGTGRLVSCDGPRASRVPRRRRTRQSRAANLQFASRHHTSEEAINRLSQAKVSFDLHVRTHPKATDHGRAAVVGRPEMLWLPGCEFGPRDFRAEFRAG